jgi:hypothetical protein
VPELVKIDQKAFGEVLAGYERRSNPLIAIKWIYNGRTSCRVRPGRS